MTLVLMCQLILAIIIVCINLPSAGIKVTNLIYVELIFKNKQTSKPEKHHQVCHSTACRCQGSSWMAGCSQLLVVQFILAFPWSSFAWWVPSHPGNSLLFSWVPQRCTAAWSYNRSSRRVVLGWEPAQFLLWWLQMGRIPIASVLYPYLAWVPFSCTDCLLGEQNHGKFSAPDVLKGQSILSISVLEGLAEDAFIWRGGWLPNTVTWSLNYFEKVYLI